MVRVDMATTSQNGPSPCGDGLARAKPAPHRAVATGLARVRTAVRTQAKNASLSRAALKKRGRPRGAGERDAANVRLTILTHNIYIFSCLYWTAPW